VLLVLVPFQLATLSGFYYLQALKRSGLYTTIQTAKLLFEVTLNFILIGHYGMGVEGFLFSILTGEMLTSLFLCGWMFKTLGVRIDLRVMRPVLAYALPLIPVGLCQLALHFVDRRFLLDMVGQAETGVYGHGYKIGFLVTAMMLGPFIQIWHPWIFGVTDDDERARLVGKVSTYAVLAIAAASLGVIAVGRQAAILLAGDPGFWVAYEVIPYVASGYVFWALYHVSQLPLLIAKRTGRLFSINFLAVAINVGLNLELIPRLGIVGAGISTLVTFAILSVLCMGISRSQAHVPFELGRLAGGLACVVAGGAFTLWIDALEAGGTISMWTSVPMKLAFLFGLLAVLYFAILRADERNDFVRWITSKRSRA
jgi:O-antigen/teichoic acid export membrane protein